jgi:hypothetical protein
LELGSETYTNGIQDGFSIGEGAMAHHPNLIARVLVKVAMDGETITYSELGTALGKSGVSPGLGLGPDLDRCQEWLKKNGLPPLTSLVVSKETGKPAAEGMFFGTKFGDMTDEELTALQNECFEFQWTDRVLKALGIT